MKKLCKLQIKPEKLLKNEKLVTQRGGEGCVKCLYDGEPCGDWYGGPVGSCSMADEVCNIMCGPEGWNSNICVRD
jgi:hypothetical protein